MDKVTENSTGTIQFKLIKLFLATYKYVLFILLTITLILYHEAMIEMANVNYIQNFFIKNIYSSPSLSTSTSTRLQINITNKIDRLLIDYKQIHENIMNNRTKLRISFNESPSAGYANRLYSMLSSFVIALVTDSAIVINWDRIHEFIQEPFENTFNKYQNQNNEFNYKYNSGNILTLSSTNQWSKHKDMKSLINTRVPQDKYRFFYNSYNAYFFELCCNPIYYEKFFHYGLVTRDTIDKALNATKNMSVNSNQMNQNLIIQVGYEVGGNLLNKIWKPKPTIQNQINFILNSSFKDYFVIGIQLRYQYISDNEDTSKFVNCAMMIETNLTNSIQNRKYKGIKWFVTSDREDVLNRLVKLYPEKIIIGEGKIGHVEDNKNSYPRAIMDVELLSNCNELVITGGSTFGIII